MSYRAGVYKPVRAPFAGRGGTKLSALRLWQHETFSGGWCHQPRLKTCSWHGALRWKFSPTSLVEGRHDQFISPGAGTALSSSLMQAFWAYLSCDSLWAYWALRACVLAQLEVGFLVVCRPLWPSRREFFNLFIFHFLLFSALIFFSELFFSLFRVSL